MRFVGVGLLAVAVAMTPMPAAAADDPGGPQQWGMRMIGAEAAWAVGTGANMVIAVIDTGVDADHEDLGGKVLPGRNFVDPGKPAHDDNGHGTHVAGIAAASSNNGLGVMGTAPGARILPVKVLAANGTGKGDHLSQGIRWAADNGAHVINLSLGVGIKFEGTYITTTGAALQQAVSYAWAKGAIVVVAAGNDESAISVFATQPALVVTATDDEDRKASYATEVGQARWGMAAPGGAGDEPATENILSTYWVRGRASTYAHAAGTSMAAPHVAGAAAVLRERGLDKQQTVDRLRATAEDLGTPGRDDTFGDGRLDLARAVQGLPPAPRSQATPTGGGPTTTARRGSGRTTSTTAPPVPESEGLIGAIPGGALDLAPFDANGPAAGGTEVAGPDEEAGRRGPKGDDGSDRPWGAAAGAVGLLAAAAAGIVRARRS